MKTAKSLSLIIILAAVCGAGCRQGQGPAPQSLQGDYDGMVTQIQQGQTTEVAVEATIQASNNNLNLHVVEPTQTYDLSIDSTGGNQNSIQLHFPLFFQSAVQLQGEGDDCFKSADNLLLICKNNNEVSLKYIQDNNSSFTIILDRHITAAQAPEETPRDYKLSELMAMAKSQSFTSQLQFENYVQSRVNAQLAHNNLTPQASLTTFLTPISFDMKSVVTEAGDLLPFLFPSRWLEADAASRQADADFDAFLIMKADAANLSEDLVYTILQDQETLARYQEIQPHIAAIYELVQKQETLQLVPQGTAASIYNVLEVLKESIATLQESIGEELRGLSSDVGLVNADGILSVTMDSTDSVESPVSFDPDASYALLKDRSLEIQQLQSVAVADKDTSASRVFSWIDPSGGQGLGLGYPTFLEAGNVPTAEANIQLVQLQNTLKTQLQNTSDEINQAVKTYSVAKTNLGVQNERVLQTDRLFRLFGADDISNFEAALQDQLSAEAEMITAKYSYLVANSKRNRLLLIGPYLDIYSMIGQRQQSQQPQS